MYVTCLSKVSTLQLKAQLRTTYILYKASQETKYAFSYNENSTNFYVGFQSCPKWKHVTTSTIVLYRKFELTVC